MSIFVRGIVLGFAFLLFSESVFAQEGQLRFEQGDESHAVRLVPGVVALVLEEAAALDDEQIKSFVERQGARSVLGLPPQIIVVETDVASSDLSLFAQDVASELGERVVQTGVLIEVGESNSPFVVTNEIIVQFAVGKQDALQDVAESFGVEVLGENPFVEGQFVLGLPESDGRFALDVSNAINALDEIAFAHPNFYRAVERRQAMVIPNDTFFDMQWHLHNTGQMGGTADADIDAPRAWSFTTGDPDIVIAVIDDGFEAGHPDLAAGLFTNPSEIAGDGVDNDGNGLVDDVNGYDFTSCSAATPCGDNDVSPGPGDSHGTAVAGAALARSDNALGVSGTCPDCTFLPIRAINGPVFAHGLAMGYAETIGAEVITNSWGYVIGTPMTANVETAIDSAATNGRGGLGAVVLFAMNNISVNDCTGATPDISSIANVIAVSRSTNQDSFNSGGFGACMDVLGPTEGGTIDAVTTDRVGAQGYNVMGGPSFGCPTSDPASPPSSNLDYTFCFGGTSFATPVIAGVVGLMLSLDDTLTRDHVQRILQDTADKTEDSLGGYNAETGFSDPAGAPTHGYGRINAFESVRMVAESGAGGRDGVDVFIRDNRLDWGNTAEDSNVLMEPSRGFIPHWRSVDIKVDAPPFASTPTTHAQFEAFAHENPSSSQINRVYVRVRNRGVDASGELRVKLHWAFAGAGLPSLPADFWANFPADSSDTSIWHPIGLNVMPSVPPSGASLAGGGGDQAVVLSFDFDAPAFDPSLPNPDHYCLFAVIETDEDPVTAGTGTLVPDLATPRDNNVTHRNVKLIDDGQRFERLVIANPFRDPMRTRLVVDMPEGWKIGADGIGLNEWFELPPGKSETVQLELSGESDREGATINVLQTYADPRNDGVESVLGGTSFEVPPRGAFKPDSSDVAGLSTFLELIAKQQTQSDAFLKLLDGEISRSDRPDRGAERMRLLEQAGTLLRQQGDMLNKAASWR